jgi:hypothetical protein
MLSYLRHIHSSAGKGSSGEVIRRTRAGGRTPITFAGRCQLINGPSNSACNDEMLRADTAVPKTGGQGVATGHIHGAAPNVFFWILYF